MANTGASTGRSASRRSTAGIYGAARGEASCSIRRTARPASRRSKRARMRSSRSARRRPHASSWCGACRLRSTGSSARTTSRPAKITLMGPDRVRQMCDLERSRPVYADADAFLADVVAIQREMVGELVAAGCEYVQIDEPSYTGYVDPPTLERMRAAGTTRCSASSARSPPTTPSSRRRRDEPSSASTSAAATAPACGIAKESTTRSPRRSSAA